MMIAVQKNIKEFIRKLKHAFEENRLTFLAIILCTIGEAVLDALPYDYYRNVPFEVNLILKTLFFFIIPSLFVETYFTEKKSKCVCGYIIAFIFAGAAAVCSELNADTQIAGLNGKLIKDYAVRFICGILLILAAAVVYGTYKKTKLRFEEYVLKVFYNIMKALVICFVLSFGISFVCVIIDELLFDEIYYLYNTGNILVLGFYFVPKTILALRDMDEEPGKVLHTIVKYILPVFTLCAMGIVYLYMLKILFLTQMPSNEVFSIISALFCLGLPVWIMAEYYTDKTKYMMVVSILPYLFAPLIFLQMYSIGVRIYQYGMTHGRYMGVALIIFEIGTLLIRRVKKGEYEKLLPFFSVLVAIAVFVPGMNMNKASNLWQMSFLKKYYKAVENGETISELEYERLTGAYDYLSHRPDIGLSIESYDIYEDGFAMKLKGQYANANLTQYDTHSIYCSQMVESLDVSGYSKMSMINHNSCYDKADVDGINVDFSAFQFTIRETGEIITADISEFSEKSMEYNINFPYISNKEFSNAMKAYNCIELDADTVLYINHFALTYDDGIKNAEPYFSWKDIAVNGMLLQK